MKKLYLFALLAVPAVQTSAQLAYNASNATTTAGTYTDLGSNGTRIMFNITGDTMNLDDDNSAVQSIGFPFVFNGVSFNQFVLNTNGLIRLGNQPADVDNQNYDPLDAHADSNLIYAFGFDLDGGDSTEWRVQTAGLSPNRICTIQFKNVRDWSSSVGQYKSINFQIKLHEGSNNIKFVYGNFVATTATSQILATKVGVKGNDPSSSVNAMKASVTDWLSANFINGNYSFTGNKFNNRNNLLPVSGTTITLSTVVLPNNDAAVLNMYTYGQIPMAFGSPHYVTATIKNTGANAINNRAVTLSITGANTFTNIKNVSIPAGNTVTVTFDGFTPTALGFNTVKVSVPSDDVNTNNSQSYYQGITAHTFSYSDTSRPRAFVGYNTGAGLILAKYKVNGRATVTQVNVNIADTTMNVGHEVYAVVVNADGTIVAQSDTAVLDTADLGTNKAFIISTPYTFLDTIFYVGLAQTPTTTTGYYPVSTQTEGPPARGGAYYTLTLAGGTTPTAITTVGRLMIEAMVSEVLPVQLLSFTGKLENRKTILGWKTTNEINNDHFDIERSLNGREFQKIGAKPAANASSASYHFIDEALPKGSTTLYYRLKQVDKDGKFQFSEAVVLRWVNEDVLMLTNLYPNPVKSSLNIALSSPADNKAMLVVSDYLGKVVLKEAREIKKSENNLSLNVSRLPGGLYTLKIVCSNGCSNVVANFLKE